MNQALKWDIDAPFVQTRTVTDQHLDDFGHTNNVIYLGWLEQLAWAHSVELGFGMADFQRIGIGCVARRHELDYLAPTFVGERLHLATWIAENDGRADMWRAYQIIRAQDGRAVLRARTQWICVDLRTGRPRRQPPEFVTAYRAMSVVSSG